MLNFLFEVHAQSFSGTQVHGKAELNNVIEGDELSIELESSSFNLVGFEHGPKSLNQHKLVENTIESLKNLRRIAGISSEAECKLIHASTFTTMEGLGNGCREYHEDEHQHSVKEIHSEFSSTYSLRCDNSDKLKSI